MKLRSKEIPVHFIEVGDLNEFIASHYNLKSYNAALDQNWNDLEEVHLIPVTGLAPTDSQLQILRNLEANLKSGYTLLAIMADLGYRGIIPDNLYLVTCE
jgi:hypothetical protein